MPRKNKTFKCSRCGSENTYRGMCTSCQQEIAKSKLTQKISPGTIILSDTDLMDVLMKAPGIPTDISWDEWTSSQFTTTKAKLTANCVDCFKEIPYYYTRCFKCVERYNSIKINNCVHCLEDFQTTYGFNAEVCNSCAIYISNEVTLHNYLCYVNKNYYFRVLNRQTGALANMMYIHYEAFNVAGVDLIRLAFSSSSSKIEIMGKNDFNTLQAMTAMIKQIPSSDREQVKHSTGAWTWTFPYSKFSTLLEMWTAAGWVDRNNTLTMHSYGMLDLFIQHGRGYGQKTKQTGWSNLSGDYTSIEDAAKEAPAAEDFFYNNAQPVGSASIPIEQVKTKLIALIGSEVIDKSTFRKAAMKYHPDRNNGDGSKMSELNYLYQQYIQMGG